VPASCKKVLAGLLALLLLLAATLSVSHALHQSLHHDGPGNGHLCLICSLVKGQLSAADVACVCAVLIFGLVAGVRWASVTALPDFEYRLSRSRAPPRY